MKIYVEYKEDGEIVSASISEKTTSDYALLVVEKTISFLTEINKYKILDGQLTKIEEDGTITGNV